jgi:hypothetical protein
MPLIAIAVWSLAPLIGYLGVRRKMAGQGGTALIVLALVLEVTGAHQLRCRAVLRTVRTAAFGHLHRAGIVVEARSKESVSRVR